MVLKERVIFKNLGILVSCQSFSIQVLDVKALEIMLSQMKLDFPLLFLLEMLIMCVLMRLFIHFNKL
jgi:hypothetical protein